MDPEIPLSKTRKKKHMLALQELGEQLVTLSAEQLEQLELPAVLFDAVVEAKHINKFGALRRQLQYIGRLMRDIDAEPIQAKLDSWRGSSRSHTARLHYIERWRMRLLEDQTALAELAQHFPHADLAHIRVLIRNTYKEKVANKPPKSFRTLFQVLSELIPESERHTP